MTNTVSREERVLKQGRTRRKLFFIAHTASAHASHAAPFARDNVLKFSSFFLLQSNEKKEEMVGLLFPPTSCLFSKCVFERGRRRREKKKPFSVPNLASRDKMFPLCLFPPFFGPPIVSHVFLSEEIYSKKFSSC